MHPHRKGRIGGSIRWLPVVPESRVTLVVEITTAIDYEPSR